MKQDIADVLSAQLYSIPSATVLFLKPSHLELLTNAILREAKKSFVTNLFAWRHKLAGISEGFVSKDSLWDRLVYDGARARVVGEGAGTFRMVVVGEGVLYTLFHLTNANSVFRLITCKSPYACSSSAFMPHHQRLDTPRGSRTCLCLQRPRLARLSST